MAGDRDVVVDDIRGLLSDHERRRAWPEGGCRRRSADPPPQRCLRGRTRFWTPRLPVLESASESQLRPRKGTGFRDDFKFAGAARLPASPGDSTQKELRLQSTERRARCRFGHLGQIAVSGSCRPQTIRPEVGY